MEAVLFLSREPLATGRIAQLANLADGNRARKLVLQLASMYDQRGSAFQVVEVAGGFQLLTRGPFSRWLRRLAVAPEEVRLSAPAMETLAVVAYRQPVMRVEIEAIRGVQSGEILRQLIERELVRISGRSQELGRPFLYGTTKQFLRLFGLRSLEELPRARSLQGAPLEALANAPLEGDISSTSQGHEREDEEAAAVSTQMAPDSKQTAHLAPEDRDPTRMGQAGTVLASVEGSEEGAEPEEEWDETYDEDEEEYEDEYEDEYEYDDDDEDEDEDEGDDEGDEDVTETEDDQEYDDDDEDEEEEDEDSDEEYEDEDLEGDWEEVEDEELEEDDEDDEDDEDWDDDDWDYDDDDEEEEEEPE